MHTVPTCGDPRTPDPWTPLDNQDVRDLAVTCWRKGQPIIEIAQALDLCAEELADLLNDDQDTA